VQSDLIFELCKQRFYFSTLALCRGEGLSLRTLSRPLARRFVEDEWPMLIIGIHGASIPVRRLDPVETILFGGQPSRLSEEQVPYPLIERIHAATKLNTESTTPSLGQARSSGRGEITLPLPVSTSRSFADVVRT
jgi:hypothetical protein